VTRANPEGLAPHGAGAAAVEGLAPRGTVAAARARPSGAGRALTARRGSLAALAGLALALGACRGGLSTGEGNAFPCDFNAPGRDAACSPGEVCSVNNVCTRFVYEGPQFEGTAPLPITDGGRQVAPTALRFAVGALARNLDTRDFALSPGGSQAVARIERDALGVLRVSALTDAGFTVRQLSALGAGPARRLLAVVDGPDSTAGRVRTDEGTFVRAERAPGSSPLAGARQVHPLTLEGPTVSIILAGEVPEVGWVRFPVGPQGPFYERIAVAVDSAGVATLDGGAPLRAYDVRRLDKASGALPLAVVLTERGFYALGPDGAALPQAPLNDEDDFDPRLSTSRPDDVTLRSSADGTLWAYTFDGPAPADGGLAPNPQLLSTWVTTRVGSTQALRRPWEDCRPCAERARLLAIAPVVDSARRVEVLCGSLDAQGKAVGAVRLLQVTGSIANDSKQACATTELPLPFDAAQLARLPERDAARPVGALAFDVAAQAGVTLGGLRGQVWSGAAFSTAEPLFLERVPVSADALPLGSDGGEPQVTTLVATDRALGAELLPGNYQLIQRGSLAEAAGPEATPAALVKDALGWVLLSTGDLVKVSLTRTAAQAPVGVGFGPRLLDARGQPARAPFFGEAFRDPQSDALVSFTLAADDSLFEVPNTFAPQEAPGALAPMTPVLTPEPGVPIRSFTLERSAAGTNGVDLVRGYLVTARNLYLFSLAGSPARWTSRPILLAGSEPVEVWMDNPRGGLGRAGYRDGSVFTLPGGFLLAQPLTHADGGAGRVLDYENLGGWPVAYADDGLYLAFWDKRADDKLDNKDDAGELNQPMTWRKATLPDGGEPWLGADGAATRGFLHVLAGAKLRRAGDNNLTQRFLLRLFTDEAVYEVGEVTRVNRFGPNEAP
jgi:hypothetical protein